MAPSLPSRVDRFGNLKKKEWPYPSPKLSTWDKLDDRADRRAVVSPDFARRERVYGVMPTLKSAAKLADQLGSSGSKPINAPQTNIRKRKLLLDD